MRLTRLFAAALIAGIMSVPAMAGDGAVPKSTLAALGLGEMKVLSDADGMAVRGKSSSVMATSLSVFSAIIFDPNTGASFSFASSDFGSATDENAGLNATSSASSSSAAALAQFNATVTSGGATFTAVISAINVSGTSIATSP